MMKIFIKDFCETVQARVVIFGMQVDNDVLYRGIANTLLLLILPCICPIFFSFHTLNDENFRQRFL